MVVSEGSVVYLGIFAAFLLAMLGLGIWVARRVSTGEDFIMGGRSLGVPLLLGTTLATLVGTGSSLGAVGFAFTNGWAGMLYGIGGAVGVFALLWLFADVRKYNFMTFSEELSFYYGANLRLKGAVAIVLFVAEIGWLGAHILGGATYLAYLTGMEAWLAKIVVALGFGLYTIIGGYMAVVITDAVQGTILFVGFTVLAILSFRAVGGFEGFSQGLSGDMDSFLGIGVMGVIPAVSLAVVIAVGVLATPSYRHRIYSARDTSTVKKSFFIVGILFAIYKLPRGFERAPRGSRPRAPNRRAFRIREQRAGFRGTAIRHKRSLGSLRGGLRGPGAACPHRGLGQRASVRHPGRGEARRGGRVIPNPGEKFHRRRVRESGGRVA